VVGLERIQTGVEVPGRVVWQRRQEGIPDSYSFGGRHVSGTESRRDRNTHALRSGLSSLQNLGRELATPSSCR
jgi:hypothetical protein